MNYWLEHKICEVCGEDTENCPPSPFLPCSKWRCKKCVSQRLISLDDLLGVLAPVSACSYEERMCELDERLDPGYADKYFTPTLKFFNLSPIEAWDMAKKKYPI